MRIPSISTIREKIVLLWYYNGGNMKQFCLRVGGYLQSSTYDIIIKSHIVCTLVVKKTLPFCNPANDRLLYIL
jgi:hypothetical protein